MKPLQPGDLITIVAPAKAIEETHIAFAKSLFESRGYRVHISKHCLGVHHYFSGTDLERASDLQEALDNPEVKAIICARGGYGCVRILNHLQWAGFIREPKWLVGFSDVTVLHQRIGMLDLPSIHASMPLNFKENTPEAIDSLFDALEGNQLTYDITSNSHNKRGEATGKLVGGNLSILYSLLGTDDCIDYSECILFIEDLAEQLYHIDRIKSPPSSCISICTGSYSIFFCIIRLRLYWCSVSVSILNCGSWTVFTKIPIVGMLVGSL